MDEESVNCKSLLCMFLCQFTIICVGTLCMTSVAVSTINIYPKILLFSLITLITFKLEKHLFLWCFDNACGAFLFNDSRLSYQNYKSEDNITQGSETIAKSEISIDVKVDEDVIVYNTNNNINSDNNPTIKHRVSSKQDLEIKEEQREKLNYII